VSLALFPEYPFLAFLVAAVFWGLYRAVRRRAVLLAASLWLFYGCYEYGMKFRLLCSGECNIRVDLLLIYPALLAVSLVGVAGAFAGLRNRSTDGK